MELLLAITLLVPVLAVITGALILWQGYVLWVMWGWFIVPLGAPEINVPWAIGFAAVVHMLQPITHDPPAQSKTESTMRIIGPILRPAFILLVGYIAKQYM